MGKPPQPMQPVTLAARDEERVWGGRRLGREGPPIGEVWLVYEGNRVIDGAGAGRTLAELTAEQGEALLGRRAVARTGRRFPLLIKLLDTADWLSIQVHPDDADAERLAGPGHFGKTEAWHILQADPGAEIICGLTPSVTTDQFTEAVRRGSVRDLVQRLAVGAGDTVLIPAGTVHALGPGLFLYEVQQTSDLTYRVYDWDRPATAGRRLHPEQSIVATDVAARPTVTPAPPPLQGGRRELTVCPYFRLELLSGRADPIALAPAGETFHALTVTEGAARLEGEGWHRRLTERGTVVVPAGSAPYRVVPDGPYRALLASVP